MSNRILCPFHEERTPSCVIYATQYVCFGCGKRGPVSELNMPNYAPKPRYIEDIDAKLQYIGDLPKKMIRGIELPYDAEGYYIVYPKVKYYIKRLFSGLSNNKYKSPSGHPKPVYELNMAPGTVLFVIEGQLNALSVYTACPDLSVISPGSAVDLCSETFLKYYLQFENIVICTDLDIAGVEFGRKLQKTLVEHNRRTVFYPMDMDFNEILEREGVEGVQKEVKTALALLRVPAIRPN